MSETIKQWFGIDVSQDHLDIAIYPQNSTWRVTNDEQGRAELVSKLAAYDIAGIVLEATGGLERAVMSELEAAGYQTRRVNPVQIRHCLDALFTSGDPTSAHRFAKAAGQLAKTDRIDALTSAHFGQSLQPAVTLLPDAQTRELQALVT